MYLRCGRRKRTNLTTLLTIWTAATCRRFSYMVPEANLDQTRTRIQSTSNPPRRLLDEVIAVL
jgi:hypothetical protein